jgi:two-component system, NarL family, response regulator LiaR
MNTVIIVEDNQKFAQLLKLFIDMQAQLACIGVCGNLLEANREITEKSPDIVLLDVQLPDGLGSVDVFNLKKLSPTTHFIMCTSFDDEMYIFESLKNGASGYILKSDDAPLIINSINDVLAGGAPMSSSIARKVIQYFNKPQKQLEQLSPKENQLLGLMSNGLLYKEISSEMNISIDTVKKHASTIYKKLQVNNKTEAINIYKGN